jgi:hypothetical protein
MWRRAAATSEGDDAEIELATSGLLQAWTIGSKSQSYN